MFTLKDISKLVISAALGGVMTVAAQAQTLASVEDCRTQADGMELKLLKTTIDNDQYKVISGEIATFMSKCEAGDMAGAQSDLASLNAKISALPAK